MEIARFWVEVLRQAWQEAWRIMTRRDPAALIRDAGLFGISVGLLWFFQEKLVRRGLMSGDNVQDIIIGAVFLLIVVVAIFSFVFVLEALFIVPSKLWNDHKRLVEQLVDQLAPKLEIVVASDAGPILLPIKSGFRTISTDLENEHLNRITLVSILCRNSGRSDLSGCSASLLAAWEIRDGETLDLGIIESVPLSWDRNLQAHPNFATITPGENKRLYLATLKPNGALSLYRYLDYLPPEYFDLFKYPGTYRLKIQIASLKKGLRSVLIEIKSQSGNFNAGEEAKAVIRILD